MLNIFLKKLLDFSDYFKGFFGDFCGFLGFFRVFRIFSDFSDFFRIFVSEQPLGIRSAIQIISNFIHCYSFACNRPKVDVARVEPAVKISIPSVDRCVECHRRHCLSGPMAFKRFHPVSRPTHSSVTLFIISRIFFMTGIPHGHISVCS